MSQVEPYDVDWHAMEAQAERERPPRFSSGQVVEFRKDGLRMTGEIVGGHGRHMSVSDGRLASVSYSYRIRTTSGKCPVVEEGRISPADATQWAAESI